jgi:hypothetical protein
MAVSSAELKVGIQDGGGPIAFESDFACSVLLRRAAAECPLHCFGVGVETLHILLRIDGKCQQFEGNPVERIKFGRKHEWFSVDWLFDGSFRHLRSVEEATRVLVSRAQATPELLYEKCRRRRVSCDRMVLQTDFERFAEVLLSRGHAGQDFLDWRVKEQERELQHPPEYRTLY